MDLNDKYVQQIEEVLPNLFIVSSLPCVDLDLLDGYIEIHHEYISLAYKEPVETSQVPDEEHIASKLREVYDYVTRLEDQEYFAHRHHLESSIYDLHNYCLKEPKSREIHVYLTILHNMSKEILEEDSMRFFNAFQRQLFLGRNFHKPWNSSVLVFIYDIIYDLGNTIQLRLKHERSVNKINNYILKERYCESNLLTILKCRDEIEDLIKSDKTYPMLYRHYKHLYNQLSIFAETFKTLYINQVKSYSISNELIEDLEGRSFLWKGNPETLDSLFKFLRDSKELLDKELQFEDFEKVFSASPLTDFERNKITWRDRGEGNNKVRYYLLGTLAYHLLANSLIDSYHFSVNVRYKVLRACFRDANLEDIGELKLKSNPITDQFINDLNSALGI